MKPEELIRTEILERRILFLCQDLNCLGNEEPITSNFHWLLLESLKSLDPSVLKNSDRYLNVLKILECKFTERFLNSF